MVAVAAVVVVAVVVVACYYYSPTNGYPWSKILFETCLVSFVSFCRLAG